jgi:hypothetical protein
MQEIRVENNGKVEFSAALRHRLYSGKAVLIFETMEDLVRQLFQVTPRG